MTWLVNALGIALIAFIVGWFWLSKPRATRTDTGGVVDIVVENGLYTPARIEVAAGRPVRLRFLRKDPNPCAEKVVFDALGVSADLPLGKPVEITLTPAAGEYAFTCQMQMYRGALTVRPV